MITRHLPLTASLVATLSLAGGLLVAAPASAAPLTLDQLLATLVVKAESAVPYVGDPARPPADADSDGCDTREEVLLRDTFLEAETGEGCEVLSGYWDVTGNGGYVEDPDEVAVVPWVGLLEAWQSGAHAWTPDQRAAYLDDLELVDTLLVAPSWFDSTTDGDDPSAWGLENTGAQCDVVVAWALVKHRWNLSVDRKEIEALRSTPGSCPVPDPTPATAGTPEPAAPWAALQPGQQLDRDESLTSPDGRYRLLMQGDGNLVVYGPAGAAWSTRTSGAGHRLAFQGDGNLVVYDGLGRVAFNAATDGAGAELLLLQNDGNLVLYRLDGTAVWSSQTGRLVSGPALPGTASAGPGEVTGLVSRDGRVVLREVSQGFVVQVGPQELWRTSTPRRIDPFSGRMVLQPDGNLVVTDRLGDPLWATGTRGSGAVRLTVQGDGNLVLYRADDRAVWSWQTGLLAAGAEMGAGVVVGSDARLVSRDGAYSAVVQPDGNLVVYGPGRTVRWHAGTFGQGPVSLAFQTDGNLVLRTAAGVPVWWTGTDGRGATRLVMQDDGNLVLYRADGGPVWSTVTGRL